MSYTRIIEADGTISQWWDDATRTHHDYRTGEDVARPYSAEEDAAADHRQAAAATLTDIVARLARIEARLWPPVDPDAEVPATVPTMADYAGVWPAGQLLSDGGKVWRNITTVPLTTPPSEFPGAPSQWTRLFVEHGGAVEPEPEPGRPEGYVGTWSASADYKVGDVVDRDGTYYRAKVAHGAAYAGTWGPPLSSVWDVVGPVA